MRGGGDVALAATRRNGVVSGLSAARRPDGLAVQHARLKFFGQSSVPTTAIGDLDSDGSDKIVFSSADGFVYCLAAPGEFRWSVYVGVNSQWSGPVLADLGAAPAC